MKRIKTLVEAFRVHILRQRKLTPTNVGYISWATPSGEDIARATRKTQSRRWQVRPADKT